VQNKTKLVYFYSNNYKLFHDHIQDSLKDFFSLNPILIDEIKHKTGHSFFGGVSIKIELIIKKIKENIGDKIIFSDVTIFVNKENAKFINPYLTTYSGFDLVFPDNKNGECNIGFILISCNAKTLKFFTDVVSLLKQNSGWDQAVVNSLLASSALRFTKFDDKIYCGYLVDIKNEFYIFKSFINHTDSAQKNIIKRIICFIKSGLITTDDFKEQKPNPFVKWVVDNYKDLKL